MNARCGPSTDVFDIEAMEADDPRAEVERAIADHDPGDLAPLAGLVLPAPSSEYVDTARFLESIETGIPLAETRGRSRTGRTA